MTSAVCNALDGIDAGPVILKGFPLSQRLYGDFGLRGAADIDVFVAPAARSNTERVLSGMGWRAIEGSAPWTETFVLPDGEDDFFLEVHSSLFDVNLHHLVPPVPRASRLRIGPHDLPVYDEPLLAGYLATHAAKHMPAQLLCFVDALALWAAHDPAQRDAAWSAARAAGVAGYLGWMLGRTESISRVVAGHRDCLAGLDVQGSGRRQEHAVFRDVRLAASPLAAAQALGAWLFPPPLRGDLPALAARWLHRMRSPWAAYTVHRQEYRIKPNGRVADAG